MKKQFPAMFVCAIVCCCVLLSGQIALASNPPAEKSRFLILASHTPEECVKTLDDVSKLSTKLLAKFDWGCMAGDHTGYAIVEARDEAAVKAMLPMSMQNARIVKLNKFTAAEIKSFHEKK